MRRSIALLALAGTFLLLARTAQAQENPFQDCGPIPIKQDGFEVTPIEGGRSFVLTGPVVVTCTNWILIADRITYDTISENVQASGNVSFIEEDLTIYAERALLNRRTRLGTFFTARGWAKIGDEPDKRSAFGTMEPDVRFYGQEIAKIAAKRYTIKAGAFTSCVQATPRWEMATSETTLTLDKYALLKNVMLRVKDVPLLYVPIMYYPINKEDRATGFLMPQYSSSTYFGKSFTNAFFLVLGRSQDATFYHSFNSKTGQGLGSDYRYATNGGRGDAKFQMTQERARFASDGVTTTAAATRSISIDGSGNQQLPRGFAVNGYIHYFSNIVTQQLQEDITDASQRNRDFTAAMYGRLGRTRLDAKVSQNDTFYGTESASRSGTLPSFILSMTDRPIGRSKIYVGATGETDYLVRQDDIEDPETNRSLLRFHGGPSIRAPLSTLPYLNVTGTGSWQVTHWRESLDPVTDEQVAVPLTRQVLNLSTRVQGPVLSRVFLTPGRGYADGFKHLIEPGLTINRVISPFTGYDQTVKLDRIDYAVENSTQIAYSLTNRLLARRPRPSLVPGAPPLPGLAHEILSVDVSQSYYTSALAAKIDEQTQSYATQDVQASSTDTHLSPLTVAVRTQPFESASGDFQLRIHPVRREIMDMSAGTTVNAERLQLSASWNKTFFIEDLPPFDRTDRQHFLSSRTTIRTRDNRVSGSYRFNLDVAKRDFIQQSVTASYNSQCCGMSVDWSSFRSVLRPGGSERRFTVSFSLAGIGSFSNQMGAFNQP